MNKFQLKNIGDAYRTTDTQMQLNKVLILLVISLVLIFVFQRNVGPQTLAIPMSSFKTVQFHLPTGEIVSRY
jgi:uncharacterized membrane protein YhhN